MVTSKVHSVSQITTNQTINAQFGEAMVSVSIGVESLGPIENAKTLMPSTFLIQYSTNNSTWSTALSVSRNAWIMDNAGDNGQRWKSSYTTINIAAGSTLYLRISGSIAPVSTVRVTTPDDDGYTLSTSGVNVGTVVAGTYDLKLSVPYLTVTPTIGANGTVKLTYNMGDNTYTEALLTSGTSVNVTYGSNITYKVESNSGYEISSITVNGSPITL